MIYFEPASDDIRDYGINTAKKIARINALRNAAGAIRKNWGDASAVCYRDAILKVCGQIELEHAILERDIQANHSHVIVSA